jgi:hypothetical protein
MALISTVDRNKLYTHIKHEFGYPQRPFEIKDEQMDSFLEMSIEDYSSYVNDWLIQQQWVSLQGLDVEKSDFLTAYTSKENTFMKSFTFAYSKQVGLGTNAPAGARWELKRDYIVTSANTQHYIIPAGREVNEVLWETPPSIDGGLVDPFAVSNWSSGGMGWSYMGRPASYVQPTYSLLLAAQDRRQKSRILQSELTYKITGLADGSKLLHLYPVPGSRNEIRGRWGKHYQGRKVWYWYYDNNGERDKCLEENSDIVRLPSDAPINVLKWENVNDVARQQIRELLLSKVMIVTARIRGFYSGEVGSANKQLVLDYRQLGDYGDKLREETRVKIFDALDKISLVQLTTDRATIAENVNKERGYQPPMYPIVTF